MVTSLTSKPKINNVFIYFLNTGKSSHHVSWERLWLWNFASLWKKNKNQKTPTLPCFSKIQGCVPSQTDTPCRFFGTYTCTHGVTSAKNIVSCLSSFMLLQQNITDWVVFEQKFIVHGSGAWKSEMRIPARWGDVPLLGHRLLITSSRGGSLWGLFYKCTNSNHESFTLTIESSPTHPLQPHNTVNLEIRAQHTNFGGKTFRSERHHTLFLWCLSVLTLLQFILRTFPEANESSPKVSYELIWRPLLPLLPALRWPPACPTIWSDRLSSPIIRASLSLGFPCGSAGKESACDAGDLGSIPGLGRSPGEGKGYPLQYSGLENSMDCIVHGVAKSRTRLSDFHSHFTFSTCGCISGYKIQ